MVILLYDLKMKAMLNIDLMPPDSSVCLSNETESTFEIKMNIKIYG